MARARSMASEPMTIARRQFLKTAAAFPALLAPSDAQSTPAYDLVVRGGRVIDPSQNIDRVADVAIRNGKIAEIRPGIPASASAQSIDATGRLVTPGLIDVHVHARYAEMKPGDLLATGVTSVVDAGSRGADNVGPLIEIAKRAPNRMRILLNIARTGINLDIKPEFIDGMEQGDVPKAIAAVKQHRDWIIGVKARISREIAAHWDVEVLRRALEVGKANQVPVVVHIGNTFSPLPKILAMLRPGDVITHLYAATANGILDQKGRLLAEVREARQRGIVFDLGHGLHEHWTWDVARRALDQGFAPDTLSSDLTPTGLTDQVFSLTNVLSKFLLLGMPLKDVIACATTNSAKMFKEFHPYGSLRVGSPAEIAVLELMDGEFEFVDNSYTVRKGTKKLFTRAVVFGGKRVA